MHVNTSLRFSLLLSQGLFFAFVPAWLMLFSYLHPIVIVVVWTTLTALVFFLVYGFRQDTLHVPAALLKGAMGFYTAALFVLLFFRPAAQSYENMNLVPFRTLRFFLSGEGDAFVAFYNVAANIVLFVPYGVFWLLMANPSLLQKVLVPLILIVLIEAGQFLTERGSLDIDDLLLNTAGVWSGYAIFPLVRRVLHLSRR